MDGPQQVTTTTTTPTSRTGEPAGPVLTVDGLRVAFPTPRGWLQAVDGVSFDVAAGRTLAVVGESGCGKSATARTLMGLSDTARIGGAAHLDGIDLLDESAARSLRGRAIAMIFQDPMTALNPTMRIRDQLAEPLVQHLGMTRRQARERAVELLAEVQLRRPEQVAKSYPHELSGGMRQRVVIGMALTCEPRVLLADEPTTALDVTVQAEILDLLKGLQDRYGMALVIITHDMGVVRTVADDVLVMYAGQVVERAPVGTIFTRPAHPYTTALISCLPRLGGPSTRDTRLTTIAGDPPDLISAPQGCRFAARCPLAHLDDGCAAATEQIPLRDLEPGHVVRTLHSCGAEPATGSPSGPGAEPPTDLTDDRRAP